MMAHLTTCGFLLLSLGLMLTTACKELYSDPKHTPISGGELTGRDRPARQADRGNVCQPPSTVTTYSWYCSTYTKRIKCTEVCIWGYAMPAFGRSKEIKCNFTNYEWYDSNFEDCKPFVNCKIKMKTPGYINCTRNQPNLPDLCTINCLPYDMELEVPPETYVCTEEGWWLPPLPFCAETAPSDQELLPRPPPV